MNWTNYGLRRYRTFTRPAAGLLVAIAVAAWRCEVSLADLIKGIGRGLGMLNLFFPPDWQSLPEMVGPAFQTVLIAAVATPIGAALSIVCGLAAASNIAP